jgi:hypothetical protein
VRPMKSSPTDLRDELGGTPRAEVDKALLQLNVVRGVTLAPRENQRLLTRRDHDAALRIGTQDNHLLAIESS